MKFLTKIIYIIFIITYLKKYIAGNNVNISFNKYNNYSEIRDFLKNLASKYPKVLRVTSLGLTHEKRKIYAAHISRNFGHATKTPPENPMILIDGGIHGREWMTPATMLYLVQKLITNEKYSYMHRNVDWLIIPVLNPDGYVYSLTKDKMWRKNRRKGKRCNGVDLNRNFNYHWMEILSSQNECSNIYAGPSAFSEPESKALKNTILRNRHRIKVYITIHSYASVIIYPFGNSIAKPTPNEAYHRTLVNMMKSAIMEVNGTRFITGKSSLVFGTISGVSDDWAVSNAKIPIGLTIELSSRTHKFHPPKTEILPVCREMFQGFRALYSFVQSKWARVS